MRINENTAVSTPSVLLVPYDPHHVETYHEWMSDPQIQEATASEPLTLEEEHSNQLSWRTAGDKLTFIVCQPLASTPSLRPPPPPPPSSSSSSSSSPSVPGNTVMAVAAVEAGEHDKPPLMIGDVNLFLHVWHHPPEDDDYYYSRPDPDRGGGGSGSSSNSSNSNSTTTVENRKQKEREKGQEEKDGRERRKSYRYVTGEIDIMIAHPDNRGKGVGKAAVSAFLGYLLRNMDAVLGEYSSSSATATAAATTTNTITSTPGGTDSGYTSGNGTGTKQERSQSETRRGGQDVAVGVVILRELVAKIQAANQGSQALFRSLGFEKRGEVNYFGELELVLSDLSRLDGLRAAAAAAAGGGYEELVYKRS